MKIHLIAALPCALLSTALSSAQVVNGSTSTIASYVDPAIPDHYHWGPSSTGKAEVGQFFWEETRGISEFSLAGLSAPLDATLSFSAWKAGGLYEEENDFPFDGTITVYAFEGNGTGELTDYSQAPFATVDMFSTVGLQVGDLLTFDVRPILLAALADGYSHLGIRLQREPLPSEGNGGAWTFDTFRLTLVSTPVPEPSSYGMAAGLALLALVLRRRASRRP